MNKTLQKHIWREIRSTLNRFIAIFAITALGAGFYAGLLATAPDMRETGDSYFAAQRLADFRLLSTFGFTQDDIAALAAREDVGTVMPGYSADLLVDSGEGVDAVRLHALPDEREGEGYLNRLVLTAGRMPEAANEVVADSAATYKIGDTITLADENDEDMLDTMVVTEFTVVGLAESPVYVSFVRGNTNIGSGSLAAFLYTSAAAFDVEYYTEVWLTAREGADFSAFSQEYSDLTDGMLDSLGLFGEQRAEIRYNEILNEAEDELADARRELEEGRAEAEEKLADAWQEIQDGQAELEDGRIELEKARRELADGEKELADGEAELADAQAQLNSGEAEYASGAADIAAARRQLEQGEAEYNSGAAELQSQRVAFEGGVAQYEAGLAQYKEGLAQYEQGAAQLAQLDAAIEGLNTYAQRLAQLAPNAGTDPNSKQVFIATAAEATALTRTLAASLDANGMEGVAELRQGADYVDMLTGAGQYSGAAAAMAAIPAGLEAAIAPEQQRLAAAKQELDEAGAILARTGAQIEEGRAELEAGEAQLATAKAEIDSGWAGIETGEAQLQAARAELDSGWTGVNDGRATLEQARAELADGKAQLADAERELADGEAELAEGIKEYEEGKLEAEEEIADAERQIAEAEEELADLEMPEWYVYDRSANPGYSGLASNTDRIGAIASVLPYFFFLVAALVCLTTMSRMVEEQRTTIGTFKALGYGKGAIAFKFLFYAAFASLTGGVFGVVIGLRLFPGVIWNAYQMMYLMPDIVHRSQPWLVIQSIFAMALVTTLTALVSCIGALRSVAAELMRPKAPKKGTRVLLERVPFIWRRLKFSHKVTVRNLFRYKKRFFMTVIGVAGCTALLVTGFGLRDSISGVVDKQYGELTHYDLMLYLNEPGGSGGDSALNEAVDRLGSGVYLQQTGIDVAANGAVNGDLITYLTVAEDDEKLQEFVVFRERGGDAVAFPQGDGVLITEKLAKHLNVSEGDTITLRRSGEKDVEATIAGVVENYVYHYIYMTQSTYEALYGEAPLFEVLWVTLADGEANAPDAMRAMLELDEVAGGRDVLELRDEIADMMKSLDSVMWVIIGCAALLAFVVLYNLTNINITERQREIATLKVLGFYESEVAGYIYRENLVLTLIGALAGLGLGIVLHSFVVNTAEVDEMMFGRVVEPLSYVLAIVFTLLCAGIVNLVMLRKLREVNMIESLKSAE